MGEGRLAGKAAIVTGSGRGIGKATVLQMAREGAMCCVTARTREDIEQVVREVQALGGKAIALQGDVADTGSMRNVIEKTVEEFGRLDILINNAGGGTGRKTKGEKHPLGILDAREDEWDASINGTLSSVYRVSHLALPPMIKSGRGGSIINVGSTQGMSGRRGQVGYSSAKAGVANLTRCMALDLLDYGIRVNCVNPGNIHTERMKAVADILVRPETRDAVLAQFSEEARKDVEKQIEYYNAHPEFKYMILGRGFTGTPQQLANVIVFLASDEASFVNGVVINVDGGSSAGK